MEHFELINTNEELLTAEGNAGEGMTKKEIKLIKPRDGKGKVAKSKQQKIFYADQLINSMLKDLTLYYGKKESVLICELIKARHEEHIKNLNGDKVKEEMKDHTLQNFVAYQELSAKFNELEKQLSDLLNQPQGQQQSINPYDDKKLVDRINALETNLGVLIENNQTLREEVNEAGNRKEYYKRKYEDEANKNNNGIFKKLMG